MTGTTDDTRETRERMEAALRQIRREGWKAAVVYATVDAAAVFLATSLLLSVFEPAWVPGRLPLPAVVGGSVAVPGSAQVAVLVGLVAFGLELWLRVRRPLVERFEAGNPTVAEALRTARDAVAGDDGSRMATRLYRDVLDRLRDTTSLALLDFRRVGATVVLVLALSVATTQLAVHDVGPTEEPASERIEVDQNETEEYTGLRDGEDVLGDPEDVSAGDEELTARIDSTGGDRDVDGGSQFPSAGGDGGDGGGIDSQQAGFARPDEIEDADLVREYNTRIRDQGEAADGGNRGGG